VRADRVVAGLCILLALAAFLYFFGGGAAP